MGVYWDVVMHDLTQQREYLRSALQQDRRPLGLFLGAGAPMAVKIGGAPIIPDIAGLTVEVGKALTGDSAAALETATKTLSESGVANPPVENILDYLRTLAEVPGSVPIHGVNPYVVRGTDRDVCECIRTALDVRLPDSRTPFHAIAVWARVVKRHAPVELFTTNYDLLIEEALEALNVPYFDGFVGSYQPTFDLEAVEEDLLPVRWIRLWKLHGSVNWQTRPDNQVVRASSPSTDGGTLIYPSHLKYAQSRRLPYLALLDRLRTFLRQPSAVLVTTGFGFRDEHINEVMQQALRSNPTAAVLALMYGPLAEYPEAASLAGQSPNLSLLSADKAVVGTTTASWSPTEEGSVTASDLGDFGVLGDLLWELVGQAATDKIVAVEQPENSTPAP